MTGPLPPLSRLAPRTAALATLVAGALVGCTSTTALTPQRFDGPSAVAVVTNACVPPGADGGLPARRRLAFVTNVNTPGLRVVDIDDNEAFVEPTIRLLPLSVPVGAYPTAIAATADDCWAFVGTSTSSTLLVLAIPSVIFTQDGQTAVETASLTLAGPVSALVIKPPTLAAADTDGDVVAWAVLSSPPGVQAIVNTGTRFVPGTVTALALQAPGEAALDAERRILWVAGAGADDTAVAGLPLDGGAALRVEVGGPQTHVALTPAGRALDLSVGATARAGTLDGATSAARAQVPDEPVPATDAADAGSAPEPASDAGAATPPAAPEPDAPAQAQFLYATKPSTRSLAVVDLALRPPTRLDVRRAAGSACAAADAEGRAPCDLQLPALPRAVAIVGHARIDVGSPATQHPSSVLAFIPASDARIYLADARNGAHALIDADAEPAGLDPVSSTDATVIQYAAGAGTDPSAGPTARLAVGELECPPFTLQTRVACRAGVGMLTQPTVTELVRIEYEGTLRRANGSSGRFCPTTGPQPTECADALAAPGSLWFAEATVDFRRTDVRVGDRLVLPAELGDAPDGGVATPVDGCPAREVGVVAIGASGHALQLDASDVAAGCFTTYRRWSLLAAGDFVVTSGRFGYLGRVAPGADFVGTRLAFRVEPTEAAPLGRGDILAFTVNPHLSSVAVDLANVSGGIPRALTRAANGDLYVLTNGPGVTDALVRFDPLALDARNFTVVR